MDLSKISTKMEAQSTETLMIAAQVLNQVAERNTEQRVVWAVLTDVLETRLGVESFDAFMNSIAA